MSDGKLQDELQEILEGGDIPQRVANRLIMAGVRENYGVSKKNTEALFGDKKRSGVVAEMRFMKWVNRLLITVVIAEAVAIMTR